MQEVGVLQRGNKTQVVHIIVCVCMCIVNCMGILVLASTVRWFMDVYVLCNEGCIIIGPFLSIAIYIILAWVLRNTLFLYSSLT